MGSFRTILGLDRFFGSRSAKRAGQLGERLRRERKAVVQPALERLESRINLSFSNLNTIAQSMQLGEAALPQVPGLDASVAQMLPTSLSDIVGLNAYGNGFSTSNGSGWSQFDTQFPTKNLISGFGTNGTGWNIVNGYSGGATASISNNVLNLTNGSTGQFNGIWNTTLIPNLDTTSWTASFTLTNSGASSQDGGSFMLQTAGTSATGNAWYGSGITNGVSFSWNNYNGNVAGTQFAVTTGGGTPVFTTNQTAVNMSNSSTPLNVVLQFDSVTSNLTATVTQGSASWRGTYNLGNISALHSGATVGFVGGNGGAASATTVTYFSMNQGALVSDLQSVANTITAGLPSNITATVIPTNNGSTISAGNALTSSTLVPAYGSLPDLMLGQYTGGFTVQGWFNASNISGYERIIDLGNGQASDNIIVGITNDTVSGNPQLFMSTCDGSTQFNFIYGQTIPTNKWQHVTAVFGGGSSAGYGALYLNGVLQGTTTSLPTINNIARSNNYWGKSNWSGDPVWQGQQDELRIWNRQLSATEIAANYTVQLAGNQNGLVAYYQADQGAYSNGTILSDSSGNGHSATLQCASVTNTYGPATSTFPVGTTTDTAKAQVYLNALFNPYTSVNQPTSINFYSSVGGNFITPLLFTYDGKGGYTIVASADAIGVPSQGNWSAPLYWNGNSEPFTFAANTNYWVGFSDRAGLADTYEYTGCIEWSGSSSNTANQWLYTTDVPSNTGLDIGTTFANAGGYSYWLNTSTRNYSFNVVATATVIPSSTLGSTVLQSGVQIQWAEAASTYHAVFSTNGLDGGLHLSKSGISYIPITISAGVNLTLGLDSSSKLLAGVNSTWNASANSNNLNLDIGLGYLDSRIQNGSYSLNTIVNANLFDTSTNTNQAGANSFGLLTGTLGETSDFSVSSASQFPQISGNILVNASMPFTGQVGGQAFTSTPTLSLPQQSNIANTIGYTQPLWILSNFGNYLALAQLDAAALVNSGLNNAGGSLASIGQTDWQQVPFSTSSVNYNWGNGLNNAAGLLYQNKLSIAGRSRILGNLPHNNYGATFNITRGTGSSATASIVNLAGNLASSASSIETGSPLIATPIAYYLSNQLAGSGLGCREQPNHPGYLEFYATDPTITAFQMSPNNPTTGTYAIGSTAANAFSALGFFAQTATSTSLLNGSFEGPYVVPGTSMQNPANAQWTFTGSSGLASNGSTLYTPNALNGTQAGYAQGSASLSQNLLEVAAGAYQLSFLAVQGSGSGVSANPATVTITPVGGGSSNTILNLSASQLNATGWNQFTSSSFTLPAGNYTLQFSFTGGSGATTCIDNIQLNTYTLNAQQATYPAALSFQGLLDAINQPNLIPSSAAGSPTSPPVAYPNSDSSTGTLAFNTAITYTSANIPTAVQFVANVVSQNQYLTPVLLSVSSGTYTLRALASPIQVTRTGLQTANLIFNNFTPASGTTYVLGYIDGNITSSSSTGAATINSQCQGTVGADFLSGTGTWWATAPGSFTTNPGSYVVGTTSITSPGASNRFYSFNGYSGLAQAGQGSVARPDTDTSSNNSYVYTAASYTTALVPTKIRYYTNLTAASSSLSITPMLFTSQGGGKYTVAAVGNLVTPSSNGLNEAELVFPTLGSLTTGTSYLFGYQNKTNGVVAVLNGASPTGGWVYTSSTGLAQGSSATFTSAGIYSLDIIASQSAGNAPTGSSSGTSATGSYGQVVINPNTTYTGTGAAPILPTAMQVYATVPSSGSGWITPLLFQQNGSGSTATFKLVAAGVSQEVTNSGASQLVVEFPTAVIAGLPYPSTYVMGYSTQQVQLGSGGSINAVNSRSPGMVQYPAGSASLAWLTSAGAGSSSATSGYPSLTVGSSVFSQGSTQSTSVLTSGNAYACTFLTDATQYQPYSWLGSVQYNASATGSNGKQVLFSYADISNGSAGVNISASGINTVSVPNVSNLKLTGSANVQAAVSATRQFSLLLDANIMTNGASASNQQQQATAAPLVTNVLTSINTTPGTMPYGVDGFLSSIIQVKPSSQVYTNPPVVSVTDSLGYSLNSSTAYPAYGNLPDLQLGQYTQNASQAIIGSPIITNGGTGYTSAPTVTITDSTGTGATATATINSSGVVTAIIITNGGTGYSAPVITFSGGGGTGASAQFSAANLSPAAGFTVQAWFNSTNLSSTSGIQTIIDLANGSASDNIIVGLNNNKLFMSTLNGASSSTCTGSTTLASNTWYQVSAVFSRGTANLYLNGALIGSSTSMQLLNNLSRANNYWAKSNNASNPVWQGQQDELRIWNTPLTQAQIQANWNVAYSSSQPNLIACYKTDKTYGTTSDDSSGFGNRASLSSMVSAMTIANGSATISSASVPTAYTPAQVTTTAPGVYYLTGTAAATSGSQPVSLVVLVDGVPLTTISSSLQSGSGYKFTSNGLQLSAGSHTVSFVPQGATAGGSSLSGLALNFSPLVRSSAPLPLTGKGATAVAVLDPNTGLLSSISMTNPGSGYANPVVIVQGDTGASAVATVGTGSNAGKIQSLKVVLGGEYYTSAPFVTISDSNGGTGTGASATATITNGVVTGFTINNSGSGYKKPVVTISAPTVAMATRETTIPVPNVAISDASGQGAYANAVLNQNGILASILVGTNTANATANLASGTISSLSLTNPGQFYTSAPAVTITDGNGGTGSGASATATVTTGMIIAPPAITNAGSGYSVSPSVKITDPTGTGAVAFASMYNDGTLKSIVIANPGSGYTNPVFTLSAPGGSGTTATVSYSGISNYLGGVVTGLTVTGGGSGYSAPVVTIAPPVTANAGYVNPTITLPYNSDYAATATAAMGTNGTVSGISISSGGSGYSTAPAVTISGGGGSGAKAVATVINGVVTGITVTSAGSGYTSTPSISIASPNLQASATAVAGRITFITVPAGAGGSGYLTAPAVSIIDPNGKNAVAVATITNGVVTGIRVTNPGSGYVNPTINIAPPSAPATAGIIGKIGGYSVLAGGTGYTSAPTVTIMDSNGGTGSGATATATISGGKVTSVTVSNAGSGYSNPVVTFAGGGGMGASATAWLAFSSTTSNTVAISNGGYGYTITPTVQVLDSNGGTGTNVTATATMNSSGVVTAITLAGSSSAFSSYKAPVLVISPPSGINATAGIIGKIGGFSVLSGGSGYNSAPAVAITDSNGGTGSGATATATFSGGKVTGITVTNAGSGYKNPVVSLTGGGGTGASSTAWLAFSSTTSNSVAISNGGAGYTTAPTVQVLDSNSGTGTGVTGTATINSSGVVTAITLAGSFSSYTAPVLVIAAPPTSNPATATATVDSTVSGLTVTGGGSGYTAAPTVTIVDGNGGTGSGATATATVVNNVVTGITITNPGSGYSNPVITLSAPTGTTAQAAAMNWSVQLTSGGQFYSQPPVVTVSPGLVMGNVKVTNGPATSTFPVGTSTDPNYDQVAINANYVYTSANQPVSVSFYSASSGHFITPLLFTLNNGVYTLVASSTAKSVSSGNNTASLSWTGSSGTFYFASNTNYYVGFKDGNEISDPTGYSGCIEWSNTSSNPNNQWLYTSQGKTNSSGVPALGSLGLGNTFSTASGSNFSLSGGTRNYSFNVTSSSYVPGPGSGATATATLQNGVVTGITINNPGSGYTVPPIITIANPVTATAVLSQGVMEAEVTYAGTLYQTPPTVTITDSSGNGTGATGYAVLVGGQVSDIVITNYGSGYVSPVITLSVPTVDISQVPTGPSAVTHTFYFLDGSSWSTTTTSDSGISIQYQLIDQLNQLANAAAKGLSAANATNLSPGLISTANYYNLQAYLTPLLSSTAPTYAQTGNLGIIFPSTPNPNSTNTALSPLMWNMSAGGGDPLVTQALFSSGQWNMATVGAVGLGNIDLVMNLAGNSGSPGFTGTAQVGYLDVNLTALDFSPDIDFTLDSTPGTFFNFGTWQGILSNNSGLAQYAVTTSSINSYDLTLSAQVSSNVASLLSLTTSGNDMPEVTFTASGGNGVYTGSFSNANWGTAEGMLYISQANIGSAFEQIASALAYTDTSSYLAGTLPFVNGTLQDLTGFSDYFVNYLQDELVSGVPTDLDSLIDWVNDNSSTFTLAFGSVSVNGSQSQGLYLTPVNWSDSVSTTTQIALSVPTYAALAGGLPASQNMLAYMVVPPSNTGDVTVTADVAWQAPMGVLITTNPGSGTSQGYSTQGYIAGSSSTTAWNLSGISVQGENLDFQGTLGTLAIYFESDTYDTANVNVSGGQIATTLSANTLASSVVTSTLVGSVAGGGYNANLPVYYPTSTCYSGNFNISGSSGGSSTASLVTFLNQAALFNATLSGGIITGFTAITAGSNYLTTSAGGSPPQVLITDAAGQGTGATATATVSSNGTISLTLTSAGSGYISPVVSVVGGTFNFNNPTGTPSVTFTLPDIDNNDIAALSMANALGDPNIFQQGMGALQGALQSSFNQSMANTSQIIIGTGTSEFSQAFGLYSTISDYLDQALTPFVPTCDQNATASATTNSAGEITAITMITTGESYQSTPTVTITDNAGSGSGATATANMVSDGNGGLKVASITITNAGSGYVQPLVSIGSPSAGNQSADEQLYNEACTVYNLILQTPGLVLDASQPQNPGNYNPNGGTTVVSGQIPLFFDVDGNPLTYDSTVDYFINSSGQMANIQAVQLPLIVDFTLQNTSIPFSLGMPGIPLTINNPADLNLIESGSSTVNLTFGIDALNGFYIVPVNPSSGTQFSGTVAAGPDSDFSTTLTLGLLSGTMSAATGEIFTMPFSTTMNDPNYNVANLNNQLTLAEINSMNPSSLFQTTLSIPTVGLNIDLQLKVAGGGIAAALPSIGNTMSITWTPGQGAPQLSYDNFYIDLGSFLSDYMGSIAPQLTPITNGVQPILNALGTQTPVLGDIIGGDTSLLGLANRFGGANLGFVQALDAIVDMLSDVTSAVNYMNANPGQSFIVPLDVVATFANDFRTASSGLSKPQQLNKLPSQSQVVASMNSFMSQYANTAAANFTEPASRVVNQDYGMSGGLGISFDILDPTNIIGLITGQTVDIFHIDFPSLAANFSIDYSFPLDPPLYMTFGGGVSAAINLSLGMDSAGLEQWVAATVDGTQALSVAALEGLAQDIIMQGFFVDGANTSISTSGYLSLGVQLNAGIAKAGVEGDFNIGMTMTPNVDSSGRLNLQEMIQLAGADFSSPLNLFDFDLKGTISADAYLELFLPFSWRKVWSHSFGSFTLFNIENNPAPPTEQAASYGSLYLNMGPTAGRRSKTNAMTDEHFEIRHLGGVAGDETLSVQLYDQQGNPQYVDSNGNPKPQIYYNVDKVVGIAGKGHDIIDCTGVLSPTHLEGGDGRDTLMGGLGLNYLDGGNGPDRITGGPLADTIKGGDGDDTIQGGGGADSIDGGKGDDSMDSPQGGLLIPFGDRFGSDRITAAMLTGSTLDFSQVTQNLKVTLGTVNTIQVGKNYSITWTGAGPAKIILGKGEDNIVFTKGYSSLVIDSGAGRDRFEVHDFETGQTVTIEAAGNQPDNTFLVKTASTSQVVADHTGVHSGSARFNIDWTDVRKLTLHETGAKIDLDFANSGVTKILAFGNEVDLTSSLKAQDVRLEAASLVSVQADIIAAKGGEIALVAGPNGAVKIGTSGDAKLSTLNGNIDVEAPVAYLGGKASTVTTTHTHGNFIVEADQTIRTAMAPTPFFNTAEPAITVGQGGTLRAWSTGGTPLTPELVPFQGYQGVPRFNTDSDLDGDGTADLVSVPQPGVAPHMVVFSGKDMSILRSVYVFDPRFLGGVNVTTGDVDANGVADIILAADAGATPHVVVISGGTWEVMASFYAFDRSFKGGLRLATADADGDGVLDIITSTASGPISHVAAFGNLGQSVISSFYAFPEAVKNGVEIAAADLNNDNIAELILGTSGGTSQQVGVYRGNPNAIDYFMAYENWNGDVRVGSVKTAGKTIITTGPGPGAAPNVRTFDPDSYDLLDSFFAGNEYDLSGVTL